MGLCGGQTLLGRLAIPVDCGRLVLGDAAAGLVQPAQPVLRDGVALLGCPSIPIGRHHFIPSHALACLIEQAHLELCLWVPVLGQDTSEVLTGLLGYSEGEVAVLRRSGAV